MEHHSVTSLMIVVAIAFIVPIILQRFNLRFIPVVIAEIIAGLIIGKSGFNLISEDPYLELLSLLGFIFLMFISGLEIDFDQFDMKKIKKSNGPNPFIISFLMFLFIIFISYILSFILVLVGLIKDPYLMTLIISTISLGIVVPVLKEKNLLKSTLGQIMLLVTVIADFSTMILLTVYAMLNTEDGSKVSFLLVLFLFVFLAYRSIKRYIRIDFFSNLLTGTIQLGTRGVFALILFFVALSESLGAENILGAFLAGVIVSLLSPKKEFVTQLDSFGFGFFIPIFFVMVGVKLDIVELFTNSKILILMPLLFIFMYIAKLIPVIILKKWYSWKEMLSVGILTTSKLSLVIAASAVALELGVISEDLNGALILVSIMTCLVSPVIFTKLFPTQQNEENEKVTIIGANSATMLVSLDLMKEKVDVQLYSTKGNETFKQGDFPVIPINEFSVENLENEGAFETDKIVLATSSDEVNIELARHAKENGVSQIVLQVEDPSFHDECMNEGFTVYSTLFSTRTLLKAMIDNPGVIKLITRHNELIKEIYISNFKYDHTPISNLPFLGDSLILHIYRGDQMVVPRGDTIIQRGDRLLVSGNIDSINKIKAKLD